MTAADVLAANGILRAGEVVELAKTAGLDVACAAVLLQKESGGGRNVWGHDAVPTGGAYDKGGVVTRANYLAYRAALAKGTAGRQGCGPTQLTYGPFQDQADQAGGCWEWRANTLTGFRILAALIRVAGEPDGFRRYNGSGPAAERYAADAAAKLARWRSLLKTIPAVPAAPPEVDVPLTANEINAIADAVWMRPRPNYWGDGVGPIQVLNGTEARASDVQNKVAAPGGVDLDALAAKVVDLLAARLGRG